MTAQEVINFAKSSELKKISDNALNESDLLSFINLGLVELYKRFSLKTGEELVTLSENITEYTLTSDIMCIIDVVNENGYSLNINSENDALSILTPGWNTIQVPNPSEGAVLSIVFKAPPQFITQVTETVPIPLSLLEPLLHYIGYRAHGAQDGNIQAENNTHYTRFEASCRRVKELGLVTSDDVDFVYSTAERGYL